LTDAEPKDAGHLIPLEMPNQHGGKAYKKGSKKKVQQQADNAARFNGRDDNQNYARVTRILGNRRVLCFCNDGIERVAKIRGALCRGPKRQKIEVDDIVITSARSFDDSDSDSDSEGATSTIRHVDGGAMTATGRRDVVDILDKVAKAHWRQLRKEGDLHKDLFPGANIDGLDDIFEHNDEEEGSATATATATADDSDIDIADI
jgi:initiation factor 1A